MALITAELNQSALKGGQRLPRRVFDRTINACASALDSPPKLGGGRRGYPLSIAFVSDREMRRLNKQWRGKDAVTDVLSFELEGQGLRSKKQGEILLSYTQAKRQAAERGHSTRDEVVFLLVHGILHVFGYDHERPTDAKRMFPLQTKILTRLGVDPRL